MTRVEKIEREIEALSPEEFRRLADWFAAFQEQKWDAQIESDLAQGKLDELVEQAREDIATGRVKPL